MSTRSFRKVALVIGILFIAPLALASSKSDAMAPFEFSEISSALHVLPPIGEDTGDINNFDETLTEYLTVSVWQFTGEDEYIQLIEFTCEKKDKGLDYIILEDNQYHVNWNIKKADAGKDYLIHFTIANLSVGYVTYTPKVGRTIPIKFRIDNHPKIRARIFSEKAIPAQESTLALIDEFDLNSSEITQILTDEGYNTLEIGEVLRDVFGVSPQEAAQLLSSTDSYSASDIALVLINVFGLGDDAFGVSHILKDVGFSSSQIQDVLIVTFGLNIADIANILKALGFTTEELFAATSKELAKKFAPQLRFDYAATTFPMSAQEFFDECIERECSDLFENKDPSTLTDPSRRPPTYFKAFKVGNQIRIMYWWYYGNQPGCFAFYGDIRGVHRGDWEKVMVTLSEDMTHVVAVTFSQHGGWYTRLANGGDSDRFLGADYKPGLEFYGDHPVVYVGKDQHGSYHNQGGLGDPITGISFCNYFYDYRRNYADLMLNSQNNLKSLADFEEPWMLEEVAVSNVHIGTGDGETKVFDLDSKYVNPETVQIKVDGIIQDENEWSFINRCYAYEPNGVDQIAFNNVAPDNGAEITADYDKAHFRWGSSICPFDTECGPDVEDKPPECGISAHPIKRSTPEKISYLECCQGYDATIWGKTRGCFESQCGYHDNQNLWTDLWPGNCSHCPSGYLDMFFYCWKTGWPWEWRFTGALHYRLNYTLGRSDKGLSEKR